MTNDIENMFAISPMLKPGELEKMVGSENVLPSKELVKATPEQALQDFNIARANVLEVIDNSRIAMNELVDIAHGSGDSDFYDSLNSALKVMLEANRDLIDMHVKLQKISENLSGAAKQVQNNLFVGSTSDLQKMLNDLKKKDDK